MYTYIYIYIYIYIIICTYIVYIDASRFWSFLTCMAMFYSMWILFECVYT